MQGGGTNTLAELKDAIRINKYIAQCGICSRRDADLMIQSGRVKVNGVTAQNGDRITREDEVWVDGRVVDGSNCFEKSNAVVIAYYKPVGVVCTERDEHASKKVTDEINYDVRVTYAGRLDKDSEGLLLLTNDGDLINHMMRGSNQHEKEYIVKLDRRIKDDDINKLRNGIYLKELKQTTRPCKVEKIGPYTIRMVLTQGLNRQIRRMCQALHYEVKSLKRIRVMSVELGNLRPGEYRELSEKEIKELWNIRNI